MRLYCKAIHFDELETTIINVNVGDSVDEVIYQVINAFGYTDQPVGKCNVHVLKGVIIPLLVRGDSITLEARLYPF